MAILKQRSLPDVSDLKEKLAEKSGEYYEASKDLAKEAGSWASENYGKLIGISVFAALLVGFGVYYFYSDRFRYQSLGGAEIPR